MLNKTVKLKPVSITLGKNDGKLSVSELGELLHPVMRVMADECQAQVEENGEALKILLTRPFTPSGDRWKKSNMKLGQLGAGLLTSEARGLRSQSMIKYMISTMLSGAITSWAAREDIVNATTNKYVSNGAKRTVSDEPPTFGLKLPLSSVNGNYSTMTASGGRLVLKFIAGVEWATATFNVPKKYQSGKILKPDITISKNGQLSFNFTIQSERKFPSVSADYIIGVDYGIHSFATWAVVNMKTGKTVTTGGLPLWLRQLQASLKRTSEQLYYLYLKRESLLVNLGEYLKNEAELKAQRAALSRKREELAKQVGVFLSNLSAEWGNAVIITEDLSHIRDTMKFGIWNRGRLDHWVKWKQEEAGGLCYKVNAAFTSQDCSECGYRSNYFEGRLFVCRGCGFCFDRDENAAVNIAKRGVSMALKSVQTRSKRQAAGEPCVC